MFIIYGTKVEERKLGVVMDACSKCQAAVRFTVIEFTTCSHIYYIPCRTLERSLGIECTKCLTVYVTERQRYNEIRPKASASQLTDRQLLNLTNPRLAERLERIDAELKNETNPKVGEPTEKDPRVIEAEKALVKIPDPPQKILSYLNELGRWHQLGPLAQEQLLEATKRELRIHKFTMATNQVAAEAIPSRPKIWILIPIAILLFAVLVGVAYLLPTNDNPRMQAKKDDQNFNAMVVFSLMFVVVGVLVLHLYRLRVWVRKTVLPAIDRTDVTANGFKEFLHDSHRHRPPFTPEGKKLVKDALRIESVLSKLKRQS